MELDLSKLVADVPIAVHFSSKDQAEIFYSEIKRQYPSVVRAWSHPIYDSVQEKDGGVCYCPYFNHLEAGFASMTHGSKYTYEVRRGYKVIEFEELIFNLPELETNPIDLQIEFLLGI